MKYLLIIILFASCKKCHECTTTVDGAIINVQQLCNTPKSDIESTRVNASGEIVKVKCK